MVDARYFFNRKLNTTAVCGRGENERRRRGEHPAALVLK